MQGIPMYPDSLNACGVNTLFDATGAGVSGAALRKMAGNSFSQPCMCAFIGFVLAHLKPSTDSTTCDVNAKHSHIVYTTINLELDSESDKDQDEDIN